MEEDEETFWRERRRGPRKVKKKDEDKPWKDPEPKSRRRNSVRVDPPRETRCGEGVGVITMREPTKDVFDYDKEPDYMPLDASRRMVRVSGYTNVVVQGSSYKRRGYNSRNS
jgi:hypothetical protein